MCYVVSHCNSLPDDTVLGSSRVDGLQARLQLQHVATTLAVAVLLLLYHN